MKFVRLTLCALAAAAALACHAEGAALDGKWTVNWNSPNGSPLEASMELHGQTGEFKLFRRIVRGRPDPCDSIVAPVQVDQEGDDIHIRASYSKVLTGCQDRHLVMKRVGDSRLEGAFKSGTPVVATK